jgi:hypothetical protein
VSGLKLKVVESRALRIALRVFAAECLAVGGLLAYAVVHTAVSARGARTGVAIAYTAGAVALVAIASFLVWLSVSRSRTDGIPGPA